MLTVWNPALFAATDATSVSPMSWGISMGVIVLALVALLLHAYTTRSGIIARAATKEAVRQPVFLLVMAIALVVLLINTVIPFFTFGDDVKMLKDCGLATLLISGLMLAVWTSSMSVASEIEGKTTMTLLSKPINRRQFILGKYFGILQAVLLLLIPLMLCFLVLVYIKVGYDAREAAKQVPDMFLWKSVSWASFQIPGPIPVRWNEVTQVLPGLVLIFLEIAVVSAISVAISTRMPMVVNLVCCLAIFVVGHLTPLLVKTAIGNLEFVKFMAQMIAVVLPNLEVFNIQAAVATGATVPPVYLGNAALYGAAYCAAAILLAFVLFEDRDLT